MPQVEAGWQTSDALFSRAGFTEAARVSTTLSFQSLSHRVLARLK
jgi:hypothetical protein